MEVSLRQAAGLPDGEERPGSRVAWSAFGAEQDAGAVGHATSDGAISFRGS
jgi:hypothetical protein